MLKMLLIRKVSSVKRTFSLISVLSAASFWGCSFSSILSRLLLMVLLDQHGHGVGDEGDGSQEKEDRDEADVWSGSGESEIGLCLVVSEVDSIHGDADWCTLLVDRVGAFVEWRRRALDERLVDVDGRGLSEAAELASHRRQTCRLDRCAIGVGACLTCC